MTNPLQLPLLDSSIYTENGDDYVEWQPSHDPEKLRRPSNRRITHVRDADEYGERRATLPPVSSSRAVRFARFGLLSFVFAVISFLLHSVAFVGRSRHLDWKLVFTLDRMIGTFGKLSPNTAAIVGEVAYLSTWTAVVSVALCLVRSVALRIALAYHRRNCCSFGQGGEGKSSNINDGATMEMDGTGQDRNIKINLTKRDDSSDEAMDWLDGAFTVGSTMGFLAYVVAVRRWWEPPVGLPPVGAWAYGIWGTALLIALIIGLAPLLNSEEQEEVTNVVANKRTSLEEC
mmetsp:Transcript_16209/g.46707  ORF Transcript_16209/g.46707 Transcript_16209/m.46707 type:complete len:288 (-) Transcript_16209:167-1030(-)